MAIVIWCVRNVAMKGMLKATIREDDISRTSVGVCCWGTNDVG